MMQATDETHTPMRRIARGMLATILIGSGVAIIATAPSTTGTVVGGCTIGVGITTAYHAACGD